MTEEKILLASGELTYFRAGSGSALLYLHPAGGVRRSAVLAGHGQSFALYVPVIPGFEGTEFHPGVQTRQALAALIAEFASRVIGGRCDVMGWSFGGAVALADALAHPDQTKGLVILDTDFIVDFVKTCLAAGRAKADCQKEYDDDIDAKSLETELVKTIHPLPGVPLRIVSALQFPECDPANPDSLHVSISGRDVTAKDCATLARKIAALQQQGWSAVNPKLKQTLVDANHDGLIDQAGDQIKAIILDVVEAARTNR